MERKERKAKPVIDNLQKDSGRNAYLPYKNYATAICAFSIRA